MRKTASKESSGNRSFLLLMSLLLGGMVVALPVYLLRKGKPEANPTVQAGDEKAAVKPPLWATGSSAGKPVSVRELQPALEVPASTPETDPDYPAKLSKHRAIQNFLSSPVRDTRECRTILKLLMENGYGIEQLELAYRAAWEVRNKDPFYSQTQFYTGDGQKVTDNNPDIQAFTAQLFERAKEEQAKVLQEKGAIKEEELIGALLEIRPKIAWPAGIKGNPKAGGNLQGDQQLEEYLETHPEKDLSAIK